MDLRAPRHSRALGSRTAGPGSAHTPIAHTQHSETSTATAEAASTGNAGTLHDNARLTTFALINPNSFDLHAEAIHELKADVIIAAETGLNAGGQGAVKEQ